ncbi:MAG: O-antigen ligase family protein [Pseudomonadota bacterium]
MTAAYALPALIGLAKAPSVSTLPSWVIALGLLVVYSVLSALWTPQGGAADWIWWQPVLFLVGFGVFQRPRPPVHMLMIGLSVALVLLFVDAITGSGIRAIVPPDNRPDKDAVATARGIGILLMMMPFLVMAIAKHRGISWAIGVLIIYMIAAITLPVEANVVAAFVGIAAGLLAFWQPAIALRTVLASVGVALAVPFAFALSLPPVQTLAAMSSLPTSSVHRLVIWRTVLDEWLAGQTLFGAGARATRALSKEAGRIELTGFGMEVSQVSVHPHNVPIEILYEYGLVGYGLLVAAFLMAARTVLRPSWSREACVAITSLIAIMVVIFSVQTTMWNVYFSSATLLTAYAFYGLLSEKAA